MRNGIWTLILFRGKLRELINKVVKCGKKWEKILYI